jgi:hypothetical protein
MRQARNHSSFPRAKYRSDGDASGITTRRMASSGSGEKTSPPKASTGETAHPVGLRQGHAWRFIRIPSGDVTLVPLTVASVFRDSVSNWRTHGWPVSPHP